MISLFISYSLKSIFKCIIIKIKKDLNLVIRKQKCTVICSTIFNSKIAVIKVQMFGTFEVDFVYFVYMYICCHLNCMNHN